MLLAESAARQESSRQRCWSSSARVSGASPACDRIRIGVVLAKAQALVFWEAVGYSATGELRPYEEGTVRSEVVVMEKRIG